jgi:hypothetical protein
MSNFLNMAHLVSTPVDRIARQRVAAREKRRGCLGFEITMSSAFAWSARGRIPRFAVDLLTGSGGALSGYD